MAKNEHIMEDLFREALSSHEMDVSPKVWSGVQSALPSAAGSTAAATGGTAVLGKAAAVIGLAGLVTAATVNEIQYHNTSVAEINEASESLEVQDQSTEAASWDETTQTINPAIDSELESAGTPETESPTPNSEQDIQRVKETVAQVQGAQEDVDVSSTQIQQPEENIEPSKGAVAVNDKVASRETPSNDAPSKEKAEETPPSDGGVAPAAAETSTKEIEKSTTAYFTHEAKQVITPNGDPYNEYLTIEGYGVQDFYIQIMTINGQLVFESNDMNVRWNGQDRFGNTLPNGVYFYEIQAVGTDGLPYVDKNAKGAVTVRR